MGGPERSGLYVVVVEVPRRATLEVGALGRQRLEPGAYVYVGSAKRALLARARRHLVRRKARRWHIDYLTSHRVVRPIGVALMANPELDECALNRAVGELVGGCAPIARFGASDCRQACPAHLWFAPRGLSAESIAEGLRTLGTWSVLKRGARSADPAPHSMTMSSPSERTL